MQESTKCTPAALMFGRELRTPVDLVFGPPPEQEVRGEPGLDYYYHLCERLRVVHELARQSLAEAGVQQKRAYDLRTKGEDFVAGALVWVYNPVRKKGRSPKLDSHWEGPCTVLKTLSDVVYRVQLLRRGRVVVLHRDRLAPYRPLASATEHPEEGEQLVSPPSPPQATGGCPRHTTRRRCRLPRHLQDFVVDTWLAEDS